MNIFVDGIDFAGKTTVSKYLSKQLNMEYVKVKKGSIIDYGSEKTEFEVTTKIIDELCLAVRSRDRIVLDRGFVSAIAIGRIHCPDLEWDVLLNYACEKNDDSQGILVVSSQEMAVKRSRTRTLTNQDRLVLNSDYFGIQQWMADVTRNKHLLVQNDYETVSELEAFLDTHIIGLLKP